MIVSSILLSVVTLGSCSSIRPRQAPAQISPSSFQRRGYQSSAVLDKWVYIDGGEVGYNSGGTLAIEYSASLLALDLSTDWSNSSVSLKSINKPGGVPNLESGGIWVDDNQKFLYTGFAGRQSTFDDKHDYPQGLWQFKPNGQGGGSWTSMNSSADESFKTLDPPFAASVTSGNGRGFMLGGWKVNHTSKDDTQNPIMISGLTRFNMDTKKLDNSSVGGISMRGISQMGGMQHIPNFGSNGILVSMGGVWRGRDTPGIDAFYPFQQVQVFDIASGRWFDQDTTGSIPQSRKEFCIAGIASDNRTYEILVYAGWGGNLGSAAIPYDEAFVLTLPGFNWVKANYPAKNPRHALSCNPVGGGQILTIGGVNSTQNGPGVLYNAVFKTSDQFIQGLGVFNMTSLAFQSSYVAQPAPYTQSTPVKQFYAANPRTPNWNDQRLGDVFAQGDFSGSTGGGNKGSNGSSGGSSHVGAIAGGVVGGVFGLAIIGGLFYFFLRRHRYHQVNGAPSEAHEVEAHEKVAIEPPPLSEAPSSISPTDKRPPQELAGSTPTPRPPTAPQELP